MAETYDELPLKTNHELMWAGARYVGMLEPSANMADKIPKTNIPGTADSRLVPFMIEAPLNSVEVLEAILKPSEPFKIHKAHHIHRGLRKKVDGKNLRLSSQLYRKACRHYAEYSRWQGRLAKERAISFVCIPEKAIEILRDTLRGTFWPVKLIYISIPWSYDPIKDPRGLEHPWALVLQRKPEDGTIHTYENRFKDLLERLNLVGCNFGRSLLTPGTVPLPECLWDWFAGVSGKTAALPYYTREVREEGDKDEPQPNIPKILEISSTHPVSHLGQMEEQLEDK